MGGRLGHHNNPGGGSVFWLELPLGDSVESVPDLASASCSCMAEGQPVPPNPALHVLVVDDVLMNRDIAGAFLRAAGHTVICVESGAEAVAVAGSTDFDVVLMDVRMPEMDGLEATRRIRALEGARGRVPIVALTAQAFVDQIAACRKAGMDSHLAKPFDPETLAAAVLSAGSVGRTRGEHPHPVSLQPTMPIAVPMPATSAEPRVFDPAVFERTAAFLPPEAAAAHLQAIAERCESLLHGLRNPGALTSPPTGEALAEVAHKLVGGASSFGFERVATLCRRFERAVQSSPAEAPALVDRLGAALEDTLQVLRAIHDRKPVAAE
jgi:CheY-like chemotaxis protein/HPt (histidine-containing phosphotransfer) domain-containing protein